MSKSKIGFILITFLVSMECLAGYPTRNPPACPAPETLSRVIFNNSNKYRVSLTYNDGVQWNIGYTYSRFSDWGVTGEYRKMDSAEKPTISLSGSSGWEQTLGQNDSWTTRCFYEVAKPILWAPSSDGDSVFWRFELSQSELFE